MTPAENGCHVVIDVECAVSVSEAEWTATRRVVHADPCDCYDRCRALTEIAVREIAERKP